MAPHRGQERTSAIEGVLHERAGTQEGEDAGVGTNLRFGGSCSVVEKLIPEV